MGLKLPVETFGHLDSHVGLSLYLDTRKPNRC